MTQGDLLNSSEPIVFDEGNAKSNDGSVLNEESPPEKKNINTVTEAK